jgi:hypothetical protein
MEDCESAAAGLGVAEARIGVGCGAAGMVGESGAFSIAVVETSDGVEPANTEND